MYAVAYKIKCNINQKQIKMSALKNDGVLRHANLSNDFCYGEKINFTQHL